MIGSIDFETYSEAGFVWDEAAQKWGALPKASQGKKGLSVVGSRVYAEHPTCEVLTLSYDIGAGMERWQPGGGRPIDLSLYVEYGGLLTAWNSMFEFNIWNLVCVPKYGFPPLPLRQLRCSMARARAHALPGRLANAAIVLDLSEQKDTDGGRLLKLYSIPRNPTIKDKRLRLVPEGDDATALYGYCDQDVRTEQAIAEHLPPLEGEELELWLCDQAINERGVQVDLPNVESCIAIIDQAHAQYDAELNALTGGVVSRASQLQRLMGWLQDRGVDTDSLDEEHTDELLKHDLPPAARRALEIRQAVGSAAVKKVYSIKNQANAQGRLNDLFIYHGARTGRCIAAGSPVLVREPDGKVREVPIEGVTLGQELWDGAEWVAHGGVIPKGVQKVMEFDGIVATPDHVVFVTSTLSSALWDVASMQVPIFRGEKECPSISTP